ncbi:hypothetical protein ABWH88_02105 [Marinobacter adhaerens]|uniref:hypothetical protein n=1 Tax=Marinobacter adhaerens TaxID=1033846 RepID=UPI0035D027BC
MAMTKCKECEAAVSKKAKKCPRCGVDNPGVTTKDYLVGGVAIVIILTALFTFFSGDEPTEEATAQAPQMTESERAAAEKAEMEACRQDLQCWGKEHWSAATNRCEREIERLAQYEVKWTDSYPDTKLSRRAWLDESVGTLSYYGDRVQFSNGYGAFENYVYRCDYDPSNKAVINVELESGRL